MRLRNLRGADRYTLPMISVGRRLALVVPTVFLAAACLRGGASAESGDASGDLRSGRVVGVHDGDTITVRLSAGTEKVRLVGIDTPELDDVREEYRAAAREARDFARREIEGKTVVLERDPRQGDRDKYGRLLRYVVLGDGSSFNGTLVRTGHAWVYDRFQFVRKSEFKSLEAEAKRERLGVWALPPGKHRQTPETRGDESTVSDQ